MKRVIHARQVDLYQVTAPGELQDYASSNHKGDSLGIHIRMVKRRGQKQLFPCPSLEMNNRSESVSTEVKTSW